MSCCRRWQRDEGIIAEGGGDCPHRVAGGLDCPFIVLFQQQWANEAEDGIAAGEDGDDVATPIPAETMRRCDLSA
jgi:hypothetical protein